MLQSQVKQGDVCFAKSEVTELYWGSGSNGGVGVKVGSPTMAKFHPNTILWKQEGGAIRQEAVAKAEWNDTYSYSLPVKIAANSTIAFEGALMSFEEAFKKAMRRTEGNCQIYKLFAVNIKTVEDCEKKMVVSQPQPVRLLPPKASVFWMLAEKIGFGKVQSAAAIRIVTEWACHGNKFVPTGVCLIASRTINASNGPQTVIDP